MIGSTLGKGLAARDQPAPKSEGLNQQQQSVMDLYESVDAISQRMLEAVRMRDWVLVDSLERECASKVTLALAGRTAAPLSGDDRKRKLHLLQRILACDREMRHLLDPWMTQLANSLHRRASLYQLFAGA